MEQVRSAEPELENRATVVSLELRKKHRLRATPRTDAVKLRAGNEGP